MKTNFNLLVVAVFAVTSLFCSCGPDDKGIQRPTQIDGPTDIYVGGDDKIEFENVVSEDSLKKVLDLMKDDLSQIKTAQIFMHGGKYSDSGTPDAASEHQYQFQFSLGTDNYSGYLCLPQDFNGRLRSIYAINEAFNDGPNGSFMLTKNAIVPVINNPLINALPEIKAISLLIYNYSSQELADLYGPFPYSDYKKNKQDHPFVYNSLEDIYKGIVFNIDNIVECLKYYEQKPAYYKEQVQKVLTEQDLIANKDIRTWIKFANSLKLRMAMHIVKVDPSLAQKWAEEAVAAGVIENENEQVALNPSVFGKSHPFSIIAFDWKDTRLNASFESILQSLKHPMLTVLFSENEGAIPTKDRSEIALEAGERIVGLRAGIRPVPRDGGENFTVNYSKSTSAIAGEKLYFIRLSEVLFLRAEGALRGWSMGGSAQSFYALGVEKAYVGSELQIDYMEEGYAEYKELESAVPFTYVDPNDPANNHESLTKIGVKWNEGDNNEVKLEKIITQKYIANYPYSFEAWTDIRRTGYPRIFPVINDDGDGSIEKGDIIRRFVFPSVSTAAIQADVNASGVPALKGADQQGTRLWWDVKNVGNF